jgi:isopropylmalate/homocitrate/citramalate synthase
MRNEELTKKEINIWMEKGGEDNEKEELQLLTEKLIEIVEKELPECMTQDETWDLIENEFMEGRLRAMKI